MGPGVCFSFEFQNEKDYLGDEINNEKEKEVKKKITETV